jgi:glutamine amidotransferase
MKRVVIIDYGMGNIDSVARAVEECGGAPVIAATASAINEADCLILPGVGAFGDGIAHIRQQGLDQILAERVFDRGIPLLGICLGMQLLADKGFEFGEHAGLGWIEGEVVKLRPHTPADRVPHVGWNEVHPRRESPLLQGIKPEQDFYFVHSYHFSCANEANILASTPYCGGFTSVIGKGRIFGVQFHPEKSQKAGFQVLRNFLSLPV